MLQGPLEFSLVYWCSLGKLRYIGRVYNFKKIESMTIDELKKQRFIRLLQAETTARTINDVYKDVKVVNVSLEIIFKSAVLRDLKVKNINVLLNHQIDYTFTTIVKIKIALVMVLI